MAGGQPEFFATPRRCVHLTARRLKPVSATVLAGVTDGFFIPREHAMTLRLRMPRSAVGCGVLLAGAIALAGCSDWNMQTRGEAISSGGNVAGAQGALTDGTSFTAKLGQEYYTIAKLRTDQQDWVDADYFARKSMAASAGEVVPPEENAKWGISGEQLGAVAPEPDTRAYMAVARKDLVAVLDAGGRAQYPALAARTQARYDCWVERTEHTASLDFNGMCHKDFDARLSDLKVLVYKPAPVNAYFETNSATLTPAAQRELSNIAGLVKDGTSRIKVAAHADRTGSDGYNMKLSEKRAAAVRDALEAGGVAASRIDIAWYGERRVPVPTANGRAEAKNRVAEAATVISTQAAEVH